MSNPMAIAAAALIAFCATARAAEELVTLPVRNGVTESYLLVYAATQAIRNDLLRHDYAREIG